MADYATLKAAIQAVIYENGNQEITGSVMQATLLAMVNSLGANYQYAGIATPSTNPGMPDQNVFYLASTAGTYVNFGNIVLAENEVAILKYNGNWAKESSGFASDEKVNQLSGEINGYIGPDVDITPTTHTGYWYQVSGTNITIQTAATSIYTGTISGGVGPSDGLDVSALIGRRIKCTVDRAGASSNRCTILADADNKVLSFKREREYVADGGKYSIVMEVPENAKYLYFSGSSVTTGLSVKVIGEYVPGIADRVENLERLSMKKELKVLLVGSSYGVNTIVQFPALAIAGGVDITVGNLYSGSATLADIVSIINGNGNFQYGRIYTKETNQWVSASRNFAAMLALFDWDIIILQRASPGNIGGSDTWTLSMASDLETIIQYIAANTNNAPKIMFNSTFSRSVGYFGGSRESQLANVNLIMSTAKEMQEQFGLEVIPSAIAVQNARSTSLAYVETENTSAYTVPDLTGEGDHLDTGVGSYILGCLLYELLLGKRFDMSILEMTDLPTLANVTGNAAFDDAAFTQITAQQARIARYAAMLAVREPWTVNTALGELYPYPNQ